MAHLYLHLRGCSHRDCGHGCVHDYESGECRVNMRDNADGTIPIDKFVPVSRGDVAFNATQLAQIEEIVRCVVTEELVKVRRDLVQEVQRDLAKHLRMRGVRRQV